MVKLKSTRAKNAEFLLFNILLDIFILFFISVVFKVFRKISPPPMILENKIIGFSQFFGYPLNLDFYFFIVILITPILVFLILYKYLILKK